MSEDAEDQRSSRSTRRSSARNSAKVDVRSEKSTKKEKLKEKDKDPIDVGVDGDVESDKTKEKEEKRVLRPRVNSETEAATNKPKRRKLTQQNDSTSTQATSGGNASTSSSASPTSAALSTSSSAASAASSSSASSAFGGNLKSHENGVADLYDDENDNDSATSEDDESLCRLCCCDDADDDLEDFSTGGVSAASQLLPSPTSSSLAQLSHRFQYDACACPCCLCRLSDKIKFASASLSRHCLEFHHLPFSMDHSDLLFLCQTIGSVRRISLTHAHRMEKHMTIHDEIMKLDFHKATHTAASASTQILSSSNTFSASSFPLSAASLSAAASSSLSASSSFHLVRSKSSQMHRHGWVYFEHEKDAKAARDLFDGFAMDSQKTSLWLEAVQAARKPSSVPSSVSSYAPLDLQSPSPAPLPVDLLHSIHRLHMCFARRACMPKTWNWRSVLDQTKRAMKVERIAINFIQQINNKNQKKGGKVNGHNDTNDVEQFHNYPQ